MNFPHISINGDGDVTYKLDSETARELAFVLSCTKDRGWLDDAVEIFRLVDEYEGVE